MRRSMFLALVGCILVTFPVAAYAQGNGKGKPGNDDGGGDGGLILVLRHDTVTQPTDGFLHDAFDAYIDGELGVRASFDRGGNVSIELEPARGKKDPKRTYILDFSSDRLDSLEGDEAVPAFIAQANDAGDPLVDVTGRLDVNADCAGTCPDSPGSNLPGGVQGVDVEDGPQAARMSLFFEAPDATDWQLSWSSSSFRDRGTDFALLACALEDASGACVAWTVRPNRDGSSGPEDDKAALLERSDGGAQPSDGGVWLVPTRLAICVKGSLTLQDCTALVR